MPLINENYLQLNAAAGSIRIELHRQRWGTFTTGSTDWEWRQWLDGVTDWELRRYFESI